MLWINESKFQPHIPNTDLISRPRLTKLLNEGLEKKIVLLRAPAGYGKSALLGQWFSELDPKEYSLAWLTLDGSNASINEFLAYVVMTLEQAGVNVDDLVVGARNGFEDWIKSKVMMNIIHKLNSLDQQCVLVLEDYHTVDSPEINELILRLVREVHSKFCIVIDCRSLPDFDALSLMISGDAIEIPASSLKLTKEETVEVLEGTLSTTEALQIFEQTEGWMMAVQLAKLQRRTRPEESLERLSRGQFIPSYLTEQVLSGLEPQEQNFLLMVSYLKRFDAELTSFITGQSNGRAMISQLKALSPLIVALDSKGESYRLHHLFASYLRDLLKLQDPDKPKDIMMKASQWFDQQNNLVEAVVYAAQAKNYIECHRLIGGAGGWRIILSHGIGVLRASLREIPDSELSYEPRTMIAQAYLHCKDGQIPEARAVLERAWALLPEHSPQAELDRLVVEAMINLYEDRTTWGDVFSELRKTCKEENSLGPLEAATVIAADVLYCISQADIVTAESYLEKSMELMRASGSVLGLNYCFLHSAHIAFYKGDMELTKAMIGRAFDMAEENFGSDSGLKNLAQLLDYSFLSWSGQLDENQVASFEMVLTQAVDVEGWTEIYLLGFDAFMQVCQRFQMHNLALSAFKKFRAHANLLNLARLSNHLEAQIIYLHLDDPSLGRHELLFGTNAEGKQSINDVLHCRGWLTGLYLMSNALVEKPSHVHSQEFKDTKKFINERQLVLHQVEFGLQEVCAWLRLNETDQAEIMVREVIQKAAPRKMAGPFLSKPLVLTLLNSVKQGYRQSNKDVMEYSFLTGVLAMARIVPSGGYQDILSERELEVLKILATGKSNKEIARDLELTENTVKFHLKRLYAKLDVHKRGQAIVAANEMGIMKS